MLSLRENALALAMQGLTTLEEVLTVTVDETPTFATAPETEVSTTSYPPSVSRETGLRPI
jgi:hypothetical protein